MTSSENKPQTVLVVDFGAQYAQLIARRIRECKVFSAIVPHNITPEEIKKRKPKGLILSGGPASVYVKRAPTCDPAIFELGIPVLGICYGMQLMAHMMKGEVAHTKKSEYGKTKLYAQEGSLLFRDLPLKQTVWMSHRDSVKTPPPGFKAVAGTESTPIAAFENLKKKLFGVQFHPEVIHTPEGMEILKNFLYEACQATPSWTMVSIIEQSVEDIKKTVGENKIICGLSGGVDSSVAALLVHRAVGDKLTCVFVDHGLLREGETQQVIEGATLTVSGVVQGSSGRTTTWVNGTQQDDRGAASGIHVEVDRANPGRTKVVAGEESPASLKVGEAINRATRETTTGVGEGRITVKPGSRPK